jgi:C-terminal processing protease CtpA/Prc
LVRLPGTVTVLRRPRPPVAVLTGQLTAGSGEAVAIAFRAGPDTRSFGAPASGVSTAVSTANAGFRLSDGAVLNLTVATMGDRTGRLYGAAVPPDEAVAGPPVPVPGAGDPLVDAAAAWLHAQPACAR